MTSRHPPATPALRRAARFLTLAMATLLAACTAGNDEARALRASCDSGDVAACSAYAFKLQKGEYVLRD